MTMRSTTAFIPTRSNCRPIPSRTPPLPKGAWRIGRNVTMRRKTNMEDLGKSGTSREGQGGAIKLFVLGVAAAVFGLIYFCSTVDAALTWTRENSGAPFGPRYGHASVIHTSSSGSEYIKVIGGHDVGNYLNNVWYWTEGGSWTRFNPPAEWTAREGHTSVDFNNGTGDKLWVMGGY